jgi:hypothetical protein
MRAVTVATYRADALYPRVTRAVAEILRHGRVVTPVDVLVRMQLLAPKDLDAWRRGRVPYLERVIQCNLTRLSRLLRILRFHAHDLHLAPSIAVYMRWGKGPKQRLRFTKTGDRRVEEAYARHFAWPGKGPVPGIETTKACDQTRNRDDHRARYGQAQKGQAHPPRSQADHVNQSRSSDS